ncbi:MAG: tetratricopeptide repeat protein [Candidatus Gastranaerophilales bacterium]|nr:tetratricopeptide repeat protein [Candidatus Gastranaerophilales bacterium]
MKKKKIVLLIAAVFILNSVLCGFAYEGDISDENMQKAASAYKQGVDLYKARAYDSAISYFEKALSFNPRLTDAYYNIASAYIAQKKYDEAYNAYVKVLAINPKDYDAILQAAKISYNRKNYALTMKYLKYIPDDYEKYGEARQLYLDAKELFDSQKGKIARAKETVANKNKRVIIDNFNSPAGVVVDSEGNMYVACFSDNSIVKYDRNKSKTNFVKDYLLDGPIGLAIDNYDNIYVANYESDNILKITKGGNVSVFMNNVSKPYFLYIKNDVLFVSEQGNNAVLTYDLSMPDKM